MAGGLPLMPELGAGIKAARLAREWSLSDLADASGLSSSMISLVENGKSDISLGRLSSLMDALGMSWVDFTDPGWREKVATDEGAAFTALRRRDRPHLTTPSGIDVELLIRSERTKINRFVMTYPPGAVLQLDQYQGARIGGECFQLVLRGALVLEFADGQRVDLRAGDSAVARLDDSVRCSNDTKRPVEVYVEFPLR